jgi:hypothetical protein
MLVVTRGNDATNRLRVESDHPIEGKGMKRSERGGIDANQFMLIDKKLRRIVIN